MSEIIMSVVTLLREVVSEMPAMVKEVIIENKATIEDMNIAQLSEGKRADGSTMPPYSPRSVQEFGKPEGPIRLFDEGDFWRGIEVETYDNGFEMVGTDPKTDMLMHGEGDREGYGEEIIGVDEENLQVLIDDVLEPELLDKTHKRISA